jgi:hypothetical protein
MALCVYQLKEDGGWEASWGGSETVYMFDCVLHYTVHCEDTKTSHNLKLKRYTESRERIKYLDENEKF